MKKKPFSLQRRQLTLGAGVLGLSGFVGSCARTSALAPGAGATGAGARAAAVSIGYAAISWRGDDRGAVADVSASGYRGIQLRASAIDAYRTPEAVRDALAKA